MSRAFTAVIVISALAAVGCATTPVTLSYTPLQESAPAGKAARVYLSEVASRIDEVLFNGNSRSMVFKPQKPLADILREAVEGELRAGGYALLPARAGVERVMSVTLNGGGVGWPNGSNVDVQGRFDLTVVVKDAAGRVLAYGDVIAEGRDRIALAGFPGQKPQAALNKALAEAARKTRLMLEKADESAAAAPVAAAPVAARPAAAPKAGSDLDDLPRAAAPRRAHAVVIGIENYREGLPRADFAASDAKLAAEYFKRVLGVPAENVALLVDDRATNTDFQKHFERWLPNRVKEGDDVYVYFSGHGSPNPTTGDSYLVPYDGDPTYLEQTGYPVKKLYDQLAKLPAKKVVVAMDSCFSGAGGRSVLAKGARPLVNAVAATTLPANVTVIAASAGDQISNSYQEKGHGLFTYFFLKGLKEKGADLKAVYGYLKPEVARVARESYNADQDPQWRQGQ